MTEYHIVPRASSAYRTLRRFCLRKPRAGARTARAGAMCPLMRDVSRGLRIRISAVALMMASAHLLTPFVHSS